MMIGKSIILFGTYLDNHLYTRNREIRRALKVLGYDVTEVRPAPRLREEQNKLNNKRSLLKYGLGLVRQWLSLVVQIRTIRRGKLFLVPYPSHVDILLLKLLLIGKPATIIMDAFLGLYDTIVNDRKIVTSNSLAAWCIKKLEGTALRIADRVLMDTSYQCQSLSQQYKLPEEKCFAIPVGIDESVWQPSPIPHSNEEFRLVFWGTFIPLHGIEQIITVANLLENDEPRIKITLIGTGQTASEITHLLASHHPVNLNWIERLLPDTELAEIVSKSHCVLGIFGASEKAANVIPYKIYQALASNRPVISRVSNVFHDSDKQYGIYTVPYNSTEILAQTIKALASQDSQIVEPYHYYRENLSNQILTDKLRQVIEHV